MVILQSRKTTPPEISPPIHHWNKNEEEWFAKSFPTQLFVGGNLTPVHFILWNGTGASPCSQIVIFIHSYVLLALFQQDTPCNRTRSGKTFRVSEFEIIRIGNSILCFSTNQHSCCSAPFMERGEIKLIAWDVNAMYGITHYPFQFGLVFNFFTKRHNFYSLLVNVPLGVNLREK